MARSENDDLTGQLVDGKYRIERELGRGGMGAVYRATHVHTERTVALKVISSKLINQSELVERFSREAKAAGKLRHPNVVNVTDFGFWQRDEGPVAYLVMEYLDGISLGEVLKEEKRLPVAWVVEILEQVCVAMEKAHSRGIIHRDLKPDNIWLEPNDLGGHTVKVLDFGLARLAAPGAAEEGMPAPDEATVVLGEPKPDSTRIHARETEGERSDVSSTTSTELTTAGSVLGSPHYMSPEQCLGKPVDHRTDIYSLGVIAYEMLTGARPFPGKTTPELIKQHVEADPPAAHERRSSIPRGVGELVASAMAKNAEDRPASAAGFASALRARSEGLGATLRRAFILYTEHFGTFLLISLIAFIPTILAKLYETSIDEISPGPLLLAFVFGFAAFLITFAVSIGLIVPAVAHLLVRPLSPIRIRGAVRRLVERFQPFAWASARFYGRLIAVILSVALLIGIGVGLAQVDAPDSTPPPAAAEGGQAFEAGKEAGAAAAKSPVVKAVAIGALLAGVAILLVWLFWIVRSVPKIVGALLYGPAVIMEEIGGSRAIARSRELAARIRRPLFGWTALLAVWFGVDIATEGFLLNPQNPRLEGLGELAYVTASLSLSVLVHPIVIAGLALLYFKARQTDGETLADILKDYEKDLPAPEYRRSVVIPSHFASGRPHV